MFGSFILWKTLLPCDWKTLLFAENLSTTPCLFVEDLSGWALAWTYYTDMKERRGKQWTGWVLFSYMGPPKASANHWSVSYKLCMGVSKNRGETPKMDGL